jgi:hypothetical protein
MTEKICSEGRDHSYSCCPEHGTHKMRSLGGHTRGCPDRVDAADDAVTRDRLIEAGASALVGGVNYHMTGDAGVAGTMNRLTATFVLDAVLPLITEGIAKTIMLDHEPNGVCSESCTCELDAQIAQLWRPTT